MFLNHPTIAFVSWSSSARGGWLGVPGPDASLELGGRWPED